MEEAPWSARAKIPKHINQHPRLVVELGNTAHTNTARQFSHSSHLSQSGSYATMPNSHQHPNSTYSNASLRQRDEQQPRIDNTAPESAVFSPSDMLLIKGISPRVSDDQLERELSYFGRVKNITRHPHRDFAFVQMDSERSAHEALHELDGRVLCGYRVRIEFTKNLPSRVLWIGNIHQTVPDDALIKLFRCFGEVEYIRRFRTTNCAMVYYKDLHDALVALDAIHGTKLEGWYIKVCFARHDASGESAKDTASKSLTKIQPDQATPNHDYREHDRYTDSDSQRASYSREWEKPYNRDDYYERDREALRSRVLDQDDKARWSDGVAARTTISRPAEFDRLIVRFAKGEPTRTLWVGYITRDITFSQLFQEFSRFGKVKDVQLKPESSCAFVEMATLKDATDAVQRFYDYHRREDSSKPGLYTAANGRSIASLHAKTRPPPARIIVRKIVSNKPKEYTSPALVIGFPYNGYGVVTEQLVKTFSRFGRLTGVRLFADKGYAFVHFESEKDAIAAHKELDGQLFGDRHITMKFGKVIRGPWQDDYTFVTFPAPKHKEAHAEPPAEATYRPARAALNDPVHHEDEDQTIFSTVPASASHSTLPPPATTTTTTTTTTRKREREPPEADTLPVPKKQRTEDTESPSLSSTLSSSLSSISTAAPTPPSTAASSSSSSPSSSSSSSYTPVPLSSIRPRFPSGEGTLFPPSLPPASLPPPSLPPSLIPPPSMPTEAIVPATSSSCSDSSTAPLPAPPPPAPVPYIPPPPPSAPPPVYAPAISTIPYPPLAPSSLSLPTGMLTLDVSNSAPSISLFPPSSPLSPSWQPMNEDEVWRGKLAKSDVPICSAVARQLRQGVPLKHVLSNTPLPDVLNVKTRTDLKQLPNYIPLSKAAVLLLAPASADPRHFYYFINYLSTKNRAGVIKLKGATMFIIPKSDYTVRVIGHSGTLFAVVVGASESSAQSTLASSTALSNSFGNVGLLGAGQTSGLRFPSSMGSDTFTRPQETLTQSQTELSNHIDTSPDALDAWL